MDEDFLAAYHANYGMYPTQSETTTTTIATTTTSTPDPVFAKPKPPQSRPSKSTSSLSVEESLMRAQREAEQGIPAPVLDEKLTATDQKSGKRKKEEPSRLYKYYFVLPAKGDPKNNYLKFSVLPTNQNIQSYHQNVAHYQ